MRAALILFVALLGGVTIAAAEGVPEFVQTQHRATLEGFLIRHPHYFLAPESLCDCDQDLSLFRAQEPGFQPYYAVGDINDDKIEDFAVGLLDSRKSNEAQPSLTLVIFHGPFSRTRAAKGVTPIRDYRIDRSRQVISVFISRVENGYRLPARLDLGPSPFGSDDNWSIIYDWKAKKYVVSR